METAHPRSPTVMVWDSEKEIFYPRTPANLSSVSVSPPQRHPPISLPSRHQNRRHSNPESDLDFGEFLRDIDRERTNRPPNLGSADMTSSSDLTLDLRPKLADLDIKHTETEFMAPTPGPSSPAKPGLKNPFKSVLKEMLGGGGNNKDESKKDGIVLPYGRGGVARGRVNSKPTMKHDPYLIHSQTQPIALQSQSMYSPVDIQRPNKSNYVEQRPLPMYGSPDGYCSGHDQEFHHQSPTNHQSKYSHPDQFRHDQQSHVLHRQHSTRQFAPSPSPSASSASSNSNDHTGFVSLHPRTLPSISPNPQSWSVDLNGQASTRKRPSQVPVRAKGDALMHRRRSHSLTSPTNLVTPPTNSAGGKPGVFLHPAQAELEAKLLAQQHHKMMEKVEKDGVSVVVTVVEESGQMDDLPYLIEDDVGSVADTEADDLVSLSGFPIPPIHLSGQRGLVQGTASRHGSSQTQHPEAIGAVDSYLPGFVVPARPERRPRHQSSLPALAISHPLWKTDYGHTNPPWPERTTSQRPRPSHLPPPPASAPPLIPQEARPPNPQSIAAHRSPARSQLPSGSLPVMPDPFTKREVSSLFRQDSAAGTNNSMPLSIDSNFQQYAMGSYTPVSPLSTTGFHNGLLLPLNHRRGSTPILSPSQEERIALENRTKALVRERAILEERVRDLMWLVNNLEGQ